MNIIRFIFFFYILNSSVYAQSIDIQDLNQLLDKWHQAAADADFNGYFNFTTDDFRKRKPDAVQNEIQDIDKRLNVLTDQATNASGAKLDRIRANIQELENNRETALNALMKAQAVSPNQSELYKDLSAQGDLRKELVAAKNIVDDVNATESEKIKAQKIKA